ncbi:protein kinase [Sorangium sp. So ce118]
MSSSRQNENDGEAPGSYPARAASKGNSRDASGHAGEDDPLIGGRLGQFDVLERIGREASGALYRARHSRLGHRFVALKVAGPSAPPGASAAHALVREAQLIHLVQHAGVVEVHDVAEADGAQYMVMEYIEGRELGAVARESAPDSRQVLRYAAQIAAALAAIHSSGVAHLNLSRDSILVTAGGGIKIVDFSASMALENDQRRADSVSVYRTHRETAARADVEAFGRVLRGLVEGCSARPAERLRAKLLDIARACELQGSGVGPASGVEVLKMIEPLVRAHLTRNPRGARRARIAAALAVAVSLGASLIAWRVASRSAEPGQGTYEVARGRSSPGCAVDGAVTLMASAYTPAWPTLRFYVTRSDESPWLEPGQLRLFVGEGPTCSPKPHNLTKATVDVVVGESQQIIDLDVSRYDGRWSAGEEKTFWVGFGEQGFRAYRASGPVFVRRSSVGR